MCYNVFNEGDFMSPALGLVLAIVLLTAHSLSVIAVLERLQNKSNK